MTNVFQNIFYTDDLLFLSTTGKKYTVYVSKLTKAVSTA